MNANVSHNDEETMTIKVTIKKSGDFLEFEENIQDALNEAGNLATKHGLEEFDSDGSPIVIAGRKLTAKKNKVPKDYETPYGISSVARFIYQDMTGGETYSPLDHSARIIGTCTPRFAKMVSSKYALNNATKVQSDLAECHHRNISRCFIQNISNFVADQARIKEDIWEYTSGEPPAHEVASIAIGLDGACLLFCEEGHRQAMVGTIAFYDAGGDRLHTIYIAAAPEHGKVTFLERMEDEIDRVKERHPKARYVGISDGATEFWPWLKKFTTVQVLDFWHVTEYVASAASAVCRSKKERSKWIEDACHSLKHDHGAATTILEELKRAQSKKLTQKIREDLGKAISYVENNLKRMNYASYRKSHLSIGSGVTEAACKVIVRERMCGSGMKWKEIGADTVLCLSALRQTTKRWGDFWANISKFGITA
jgi:hypothetical protein